MISGNLAPLSCQFGYSSISRVTFEISLPSPTQNGISRTSPSGEFCDVDLLVETAASFIAFSLAALRWLDVSDAGERAEVFNGFRLLLGWPICWKLPSHDSGWRHLRVSRLGAEIRDHSSAFASVVIERLTGWLVLGYRFCFGDQPSLATSRAGVVALLGASGTLLLLLVLILMAQHQRLGGRIRGNNSLSNSLAAVHRGLISYETFRLQCCVYSQSLCVSTVSHHSGDILRIRSA